MDERGGNDDLSEDDDFSPLGARASPSGVKEEAPASAVGVVVAAKVRPKKKGRKRKAKKPKDMPRRPLSSYNIFFREQRAMILEDRKKNLEAQKDSNLFSTMAKTIAKRWKELTQEESVKYQNLADNDLKRYRKEMEEYHLNLARKHLHPVNNMGYRSDGPSHAGPTHPSAMEAAQFYGSADMSRAETAYDYALLQQQHHAARADAVAMAQHSQYNDQGGPMSAEEHYIRQLVDTNREGIMRQRQFPPAGGESALNGAQGNQNHHYGGGAGQHPYAQQADSMFAWNQHQQQQRGGYFIGDHQQTHPQSYHHYDPSMGQYSQFFPSRQDEHHHQHSNTKAYEEWVSSSSYPQEVEVGLR